MKTVAVVEDNSDNRLLVRAILEDTYTVIEFENGVDALEAFYKNTPDLILLDISLPEMDGTEVLERLREQKLFERVPVVALTAHAMSGDREKYLLFGFDDYISKPIVDHEDLLRVVQKWTRSQRQETSHIEI